ncbi:uncharacterized protein AB675_2869 [Cyphellophora attinorum]|uniref:Uncharacterized protein n=1 Tax=Cyphellophora attinorum TaxID=1664694 RepID=A0A0N1HH18_9EURO|nr:uncharacterized protein AB675_2869 [Phialophora attinorum]KPI45104.1 hypothetical protein AB675_2869 [Phialophora attinorum]
MPPTEPRAAMDQADTRTRQLPPQEMVHIRKLYLDKRFKNCINACDELLAKSERSPSSSSIIGGLANAELHQVHRAFLIYHQAISHECMGIAAHKFSQNKIKYLNSAKSQFEQALSVLPQPFASERDGSYQTPMPRSPDEPKDNASDDEKPIGLGLTPVPLHDIRTTPAVRISDATRSPSEESFDSATSGTSVSVTFTIPDFNKYSPRNSMPYLQLSTGGSLSKDLHESRPFVQGQNLDDFFSDSEDDDDKEGERVASWLPRSMRSLNLAAHTIESDSEDEETESAACEAGVGEETPVSAAINSLQADMFNDSSPTKSLSASQSSRCMLREELEPAPLFNKSLKLPKITFEPPALRSEVPRPLPRTPRAQFALNDIQSARKTAVQTLISKFEGTLPSPITPSSWTTATPLATMSTQAFAPTPITPRFDMIRSAFEPHQTQSHLRAYLTSRSLAHYNNSLADFRTCLQSAVEAVEEALEAAHEVQQKREDEKRASSVHVNDNSLPKNRLASMWLLSTPGRNPKSAGTTATGSAPPVTIVDRSERPRDRKAMPLRNGVQESVQKRAERLERLRSNGFKVRKESHGWKGEEHYECFRRRVEMDLGS